MFVRLFTTCSKDLFRRAKPSPKGLSFNVSHQRSKLSGFFSTRSAKAQKEEDFDELLRELDLQIYRNMPKEDDNLD